MKKAVLREYLKNLELEKDVLSINKDRYFTFEVDEPKKIEEITKDPIAKEIKIKEVKTKKGDK